MLAFRLIELLQDHLSLLTSVERSGKADLGCNSKPVSCSKPATKRQALVHRTPRLVIIRELNQMRSVFMGASFLNIFARLVYLFPTAEKAHVTPARETGCQGRTKTVAMIKPIHRIPNKSNQGKGSRPTKDTQC